MNELIHITDDHVETRVEDIHRFQYLATKARVCLADPARVMETVKGLTEKLSGQPIKHPVLKLIEEYANSVPTGAPKLRTEPCPMPAENKFAKASRLKRCGKSAFIPSLVPVMDHMQRKAVDALICCECYGKLAIGKICIGLSENPTELTAEEIKYLRDHNAFDDQELKFLSKHEGSPCTFIRGRLSAKQKEKEDETNITPNDIIVGDVADDREPGEERPGIERDTGLVH